MKHIANQGMANIKLAKKIRAANPGMSWQEAMKRTSKKKKGGANWKNYNLFDLVKDYKKVAPKF